MGSVILAIACIFLSFVLLFCLTSYGFFWYETANGPHYEYLVRISNGRVKRFMMRGILSGLVSFPMTVLLYPLGYFRRLWKTDLTAPTPAPPVIFIHGLYHNASAWVFFRLWMKRAGFTDLHAFQYGSLGSSFDGLLERLDAFVKELLNQRGTKSVILICHSLGGLLGRAYLNRAPKDFKISALVTLGTPYQGSKLAVLGVGRLAQSLAFRGPLVQGIESQTVESTDIPRLAFYSPLDNMVLPNEALRTSAPGWVFFETKGMSHVAMLFSKDLADRTAEFLRTSCIRE